jgi:hypothetical protein
MASTTELKFDAQYPRKSKSVRDAGCPERAGVVAEQVLAPRWAAPQKVGGGAWLGLHSGALTHPKRRRGAAVPHRGCRRTLKPATRGNRNPGWADWTKQPLELDEPKNRRVRRAYSGP